ncbi:MAG: hypothetical protein AB7S86_11695 [Hydrogenophaga sp.]|uniref:hypothetical protein n=1 Tax=Hydrogenophaga sp. TaxID=1904254 RepID=UPI003D1078B4
MGILFNTNTWRAPLQLIDCWLPAPATRRTLAANEPLANRAVQRFARAGWLGRPARVPAQQPALIAPMKRSESPGACRVRVLRQTDPVPSPSLGVRLVISGRINDVCAELDRLADQESQVSARAA